MDTEGVDSIADWYAEYDLPGGSPSRAPNYYYSEDDDPLDSPREISSLRLQHTGAAADPYECRGCGHTHPESLDERGLCPYCRR
jgi:hypothetical protein